jgi:hypothetical protein
MLIEKWQAGKHGIQKKLVVLLATFEVGQQWLQNDQTHGNVSSMVNLMY